MASAFTAAAASLCRLCRGPVVTKNSVALFSNIAVLERLGERIGTLLQTTVAADDGLPHRICRPCKRRFDSLEKALEDLENFRSKASESKLTFLTMSGKRMRDTMSISPDTMRVS